MEFVVNTENDGESKSKEFQFQYLRKFKDELLSRMITVSVKQFSGVKYER